MRRREFLQYGGGGMAVAILGTGSTDALAQYACPAPASYASVPMELRIAPCSITMIDGQTFPALGFNEKVPGPVLRVKQGRNVALTIHNTTPELHSFEITGIGKWDVPPNSSAVASFQANACGSYMYHSRVNGSPLYRLLGLHGAFIVYPDYDALRCTSSLITPYNLADWGANANAIRTLFQTLGTNDRFQSGNGCDGKWHPTEDSGQEYTGTPYSNQEKVWVVTQVDPKFNVLIQPNGSLSSKPSTQAIIDSWLPRYFTINGQSGFDLEHNDSCVASNYIGEPTLMRIMNAGLSHHALHVHGNHWLELTFAELLDANGNPIFDADGWPLTANPVSHNSGKVLPCKNILELDTVAMWPMQRKDVLLPFEVPVDMPYMRMPDGSYVTTQFNEMVARRNNVEFKDSTLKTDKEPFPLRYVMHCHVEMSTTAAGGNYPQGMVLHWQINGGLGQRALDATRTRRTVSL